MSEARWLLTDDKVVRENGARLSTDHRRLISQNLRARFPSTPSLASAAQPQHVCGWCGANRVAYLDEQCRECAERAAAEFRQSFQKPDYRPLLGFGFVAIAVALLWFFWILPGVGK